MHLARHIIRHETHHQAARIGPRLVVEIANVADRQARLLTHLTHNALLQGLAHLQEACHQSVKRAAEIPCTHQQHLVSLANQDNDGRRNRRVKFVMTRRALLADRCRLHRPRATGRTKLTVCIPIQQLAGTSCPQIALQRQQVPRRPQPHVLECLTRQHRLLQGRRTPRHLVRPGHLQHPIHRHRWLAAPRNLPVFIHPLQQQLILIKKKPTGFRRIILHCSIIFLNPQTYRKKLRTSGI